MTATKSKINEREALEELVRRALRDDPTFFVEEILKKRVTAAQKRVLKAIAKPRASVMVRSGHGVGKTFVMADCVLWHYMTRDPGETLTTAPSKQQVVNSLWKTIRQIAPPNIRAGFMPKEPRIESDEAHYAVGYTAKSGESFQGRHSEGSMFIGVDEAVGVDDAIWTSATGMLTGDDARMLCIYNATRTDCRAFIEEKSGRHTVIRINTLEHENVIAGLEGRPEPFPGAVSLSWVMERMADSDYFEEIDPAGRKIGDIDWPPRGLESKENPRRCYRPTAKGASRVLGLFPSNALSSIWSDALVEFCLAPEQRTTPQGPLILGVDPAHFGDDNTAIVTKRGNCPLQLILRNGLDNVQVAGLVAETIKANVEEGENVYGVQINVDRTGIGAGVVDILNANGYNVVGVSSAETALQPDDYANVRSELWFSAAERAHEGRIDFSHMRDMDRLRLTGQLCLVQYGYDSQGRRVAESKDKQKRRIGSSPDAADAFNLCFYQGGIFRKTKQPKSWQ